MRRKKASLNISVEAIIILIFAITMLGLGLGFIRGMFGKVTTQLEQQIANEPEPFSPTSTTPITVSRESIVTNPGEQQVLKVGVYNALGSPTQLNNSFPFVGCRELDAVGSDRLESQSSNAKIVQPRSKDTFVLVFTVPASATNKVYLCKVGFPTVEPILFKDVTLKVIT